MDGVGVEPPPDCRAADGGDESALPGFAGDVVAAEPRQGQSKFLGQFAGEGLNGDDDLRGKNRAVARAAEQANHLLTLSSIRETAIFLESINPAQ